MKLSLPVMAVLLLSASLSLAQTESKYKIKPKSPWVASLSYGIGVEGFLDHTYNRNAVFVPLNFGQGPFLSEWLHHQMKGSLRYDWLPFLKTSISLVYQKGGDAESFISGSTLWTRNQALLFHDVRVIPEILFDPILSENKSLNFKIGFNYFYRTHLETYSSVDENDNLTDKSSVSRTGSGFAFSSGLEWEKFWPSGLGYSIGVDWLFEYSFKPSNIKVNYHLLEGTDQVIPDLSYGKVDEYDRDNGVLPEEEYILEGFYLDFSFKYRW